MSRRPPQNNNPTVKESMTVQTTKTNNQRPSGRLHRLVRPVVNWWRLRRLESMMIKSIKLDKRLEKLATKIEQWEKENVNL